MRNNIAKFLCVLMCPTLLACQSSVSGSSTVQVAPPSTVTGPVQSIFYVSPTGSDLENFGSKDQPYKTIQYGVDQLTPGDTLRVQAGVYENRVVLEGSSHSGTQDAPIRIEAEDGVVIDGSRLTPNGQDALIKLDSVHYVELSGFELRNFKTEAGFNIRDTPMGVFIRGTSSNLVIKDTKIHNIENNSTCHQGDDCGPAANGIGVFGGTRGGISDIKFIENEVSHCRTSSSEAFVLNGNVSNFEIIENYIHDNNNIGLDFIGYEGICQSCPDQDDRARNGIVRNNRIINNSTGNLGGNPWYGAERSAGGIYVDGGAYIIISQNLVEGNDIGIEIASEAPGKMTSDILLHNNVVFENLEVGLTLGGYNSQVDESGGGSVERIYIHNNSFYKNKGWGAEIFLQYRVTQTQFYNNIAYADGSLDDAVYFAVSDDVARPDLVWMKNLLWAVGYRDEIPINSAKTLVSNPLFTDVETGNLKTLSGSRAIDGGIIAPDIDKWDGEFWEMMFPEEVVIPPHGNVDFNGQARVQNVIDIGAYEQ